MLLLQQVFFIVVTLVSKNSKIICQNKIYLYEKGKVLFVRVYFRRKDKIIFRKPADLMCPEFEENFVVVHVDVRMMPFHFGNISHALDKVYRPDKILEFKFFGDFFGIFAERPTEHFISIILRISTAEGLPPCLTRHTFF